MIYMYSFSVKMSMMSQDFHFWFHSALDFAGTTVGYAPILSICGRRSAAIVQVSYTCAFPIIVLQKWISFFKKTAWGKGVFTINFRTTAARQRLQHQLWLMNWDIIWAWDMTKAVSFFFHWANNIKGFKTLQSERMFRIFEGRLSA